MMRETAIPRRSLDILDLLWRLGTGPLTTVTLCALLALTLAVAAVVPQQPAGLDSTMAERWSTSTTAGYGTVGPALRALGAFNILDVPGLIVLLAAFAYHLLLLVASTGSKAWRALRRVSPALPPATLAPRPVVMVEPLVDAVKRAESVLVARGYGRPAVVSETPQRVVIYGGRRPQAALGPFLAYLGPLLILIAFLLNGTAGWSNPDVVLAPGNAATLSADEGVQVRLEGISGPDVDPVSTVLVTWSDGRSARLQTGYARPAYWGGLWLVQRTTGPALAVSGQDSQGQPVVLQTQPVGGRLGEVIHLLFTTTQTEQVFAAPSRNIAFQVVNYSALPEKDIPEDVFLVEAYRGTDPAPALSQLVRGQAIIQLDDVTYTFQPERHAALAMSSVPGIWLMVPGVLLALAGVTMALWWPRSQTWVTLAAEGGAVLALVRVDTWLGRNFERDLIAHRLREPDGEPVP